MPHLLLVLVGRLDVVARKAVGYRLWPLVVVHYLSCCCRRATRHTPLTRQAAVGTVVERTFVVIRYDLIPVRLNQRLDGSAFDSPCLS